MVVVPPTVITGDVSALSTTTATCGGNVTDTGHGTITRGICWSTSPDPVTAGNHQVVAGSAGAFTANVTGLSSDTDYYFRAYATNEAGTRYGVNNVFRTLPATVATTVQRELGVGIEMEMESGGGGGAASGLDQILLPQTSVNKSASLSVTATVALAQAAPVGGRSVFIDITGGHSQLEDYGVGKHYTVSGADVSNQANLGYNWHRVTLPFAQGDTTKSFTIAVSNNLVIEMDRTLTISGLGNKTLTIVDDNRNETKGVNGVVDVTNQTHLIHLMGLSTGLNG